MVRFGIDAYPLARARYTGTEWYLFYLLQAMKKEPLQANEQVHLYTREPIDRLGDVPAGWSWRSLRWPLAGAWTHGRLSFLLTLRPPDVFFSPAHEVPLLTGRTKIVSTVHDVAFRMRPELYPEQERRRQERALQRACKRAQKLIAVSQATKQDLEKTQASSFPQTAVVPLGVDQQAFSVQESKKEQVLAHYQLTENQYFFSVSRLEKKKNIRFLLEAFAHYRATGGKKQLVLGGTYGFGKEIIAPLVRSAQGVKALGYVPQEHIPALMAGAAAYLFPTQYEGFGLPALEAMAAGTPVIASDIPALREIAGEAAWFASPVDAQAWQKAMHMIPEQAPIFTERGRKRIQAFSWEETAQKTWRVLREVAYG